MDLFEVQVNINNLITNWDRHVDDFFKSIEADLIDANTTQLDEGIDSLGVEFPPYENPDYARLKGRAIPDLKLTGDFWSGFFAQSINDIIKIDSRDDKRDKLVKKYGVDIFGLTDDNLNKLIEEQIIPDFIMFISKKMGLK